MGDGSDLFDRFYNDANVPYLVYHSREIKTVALRPIKRSTALVWGLSPVAESMAVNPWDTQSGVMMHGP